jgi:catechol 2,3-dioxygenase-like lactoylglutathione lyase family enzyme
VITGINHLTLAVSNLEESLAFYREILGFKSIARWPGGAYLLAGDLWVALLVDSETREASLPEYTHLAFSISQEDFDGMAKRIMASGARIWKHNESEGPSLYFEDPDGHKLELHVGTLESRIQSVKEKSHPEWTLEGEQ